ncbi:MAG: molecular chaperone DnaJ, partial [Chitinophagales bacterium]
MANKRDYYETLGVEKSVDGKTLKKAYRKVAMKYHPDRNPDNKEAEDKFKEAAEAYEVLSDPQKKARYDRYGHAGMSGASGGGGGGFGGAGMSVEDIFDIFGDIFGSRGGGGGGFGSAGGRRRAGGRKGSNLRIRVKLNLEEIAKGANKKIKVKKQISCTPCRGTGAKNGTAYSTCGTCRGQGYVRQVTNTFLGQMQTTTNCPTCGGSGKAITDKCGTCRGEGKNYGEETISIDIPAGVTEGVQLSMSGKGNAGEMGGPSGDLIISIEEVAHESLKREGKDVLYMLHLNFADAALGISVEVPTISGKARIKVPKGTQSGKIFRLKGKGLPVLNS